MALAPVAARQQLDGGPVTLQQNHASSRYILFFFFPLSGGYYYYFYYYHYHYHYYFALARRFNGIFTTYRGVWDLFSSRRRDTSISDIKSYRSNLLRSGTE